MMTSGSWRRNARKAAANVSPTLLFNIDLVDARQIDFCGVLRGRDIAVFGVEDNQARVQGYGFCRCRWAGDQNHALRFGKVAKIGFTLCRLVSQRVDAQHRARRIGEYG